jgi:hypothetical protein
LRRALGASHIERRKDAPAAIGEPVDPCFLAAVSHNQLHRVNAPKLTETIHAANALLETGGCPRNFEVHDQPASVLEVQSFAGRIGRKHEAPFDLVEATERQASFRVRQAAMQL